MWHLRPLDLTGKSNYTQYKFKHYISMKSNCAERPNYEINKSTREPRMPTRPIFQTAGTELHEYVLKPDRLKRPIMCTSIDEAQNPEPAWWSDTVWQTEPWLIRFKTCSATNVTSLCQSVNLPSKPGFPCSKWPWTSCPLNCRYTQSCYSYTTNQISSGEADMLQHFISQF